VTVDLDLPNSIRAIGLDLFATFRCSVDVLEAQSLPSSLKECMRSDDEVREEGATEGVAIGARGLFPPFLQILQVAVDLDLPSSIHPNH